MSDITKDLERVVDKVNALAIRKRIDAWRQVRFMAGHFIEVNNRINALSNSPKFLETFPLIALRLDTTPRAEGGLMKYDLNVVILHTTNTEDNAQQRMDKKFADVLRPVYMLFMEALPAVRIFCWEGENIPHTPIDRPYLKGAANDNAFSEHMDAIEIQNLRISKLLNQC